MTASVFDRVLLVVESSEGGRAASRAGMDIVSSCGGRLIALFVLDTGAARLLSQFSGKTKAEVLAELEEDGWRQLYFVETEANARGLGVALLMEEGNPPDVVVATASQYKASLVVMAGSGAGGARGAVQAKGFLQVAEHCPSPLLLVR
jgi:nucleotide-binding universal stress UspA family protein